MDCRKGRDGTGPDNVSTAPVTQGARGVCVAEFSIDIGDRPEEGLLDGGMEKVRPHTFA